MGSNIYRKSSHLKDETSFLILTFTRHVARIKLLNLADESD